MPQLHALICDLDGTLLDSAPDLRQALNAALKAEGRRALTLEEVEAMIGDGMLPLIQRAYAATGAPVSVAESYPKFERFIGFYRELQPDPAQIYPHVTEVLAALQKAGVKLAICTNKQEEATHRLLKQLDLARFFSFVAGGDTFPVHKPHPGHVEGVLKALAVRAENAAMVGDSGNDILSARGAGVPCLLVSQGYGVGIDNLGASGMIADFGELPDALRLLGFEFGG
jgi:phosphoglycolate phosphatase